MGFIGEERDTRTVRAMPTEVTYFTILQAGSVTVFIGKAKAIKKYTSQGVIIKRPNVRNKL